MIIVSRSEESEKFVFGNRLKTIPFIGINDSGGTHRIGIGLMTAGRNPELTLAFESGEQRSVIIAVRALKFLELAKWVHGQTLKDCLRAGDDNQPCGFIEVHSGDDHRLIADSTEPCDLEDLDASLYMRLENVEMLRKAFRVVTAEELTPILEITDEYNIYTQ
ncbi:MAG: hypothetical protein Q7S53_04915 [bacterium]|nr:hypothetical protein [bacterium]